MKQEIKYSKIITSPTADKQCLILAKVSAARGRSPLANTSSTVALNCVSPAASCINQSSNREKWKNQIEQIMMRISKNNLNLQSLICSFHSLLHSVNFGKCRYRFRWWSLCLTHQQFSHYHISMTCDWLIPRFQSTKVSEHLFELLEDGGDGSAERNGVVTEANDITSGARDTEESGGALFP